MLLDLFNVKGMLHILRSVICEISCRRLKIIDSSTFSNNAKSYTEEKKHHERKNVFESGTRNTEHKSIKSGILCISSKVDFHVKRLLRSRRAYKCWIFSFCSGPPRPPFASLLIIQILRQSFHEWQNTGLYSCSNTLWNASGVLCAQYS